MKRTDQASPNHKLKSWRLLHSWTQSLVAEKIGTTTVNVSRWENGSTIPSLYFRQKLCELFGKSADELGLLSQKERQERPARVAASPLPIVWNVPFQRNPFFTGREEILSRIQTALEGDKVAAIGQAQAISGLGGIGKSQTAVEYAYRHLSRYQAVLWVKADSREILTSDFVNLAGLLNLSEKDEQDQSLVVAAVRRWLKEYSDWLPILDNVDDLEIVADFLPLSSRGHILLTTRAQTTGTIAHRIELEKMECEEGAFFLLRRAKRIAPDARLEQASPADRAKALELSHTMDGLPLALDQAAAYIEETDCGLTGYLNRYQTRRAKLLSLRGSSAFEHPESVATTWSLSFEKVQQASPAAADLLRLCAFLHPDAIPEEIITEGAPELGVTLAPVAADPLELDMIIRELRKFSLIRRDPESQLLMMHRLVQEVLKDSMVEAIQRQWAERTIQALNKALPENLVFATWPRCQRCLPHVQACSRLIERFGITLTEAARLLHLTGCYLQERAQYTQAEPLCLQAVAIYTKTLGPEHPDLAQSLDDLAELYREQGKYTQAEALYKQAIAIYEKNQRQEHSYMATLLNNLALLYQSQGKYAQAEPLYQESIVIGEKTLGSEHPYMIRSLNNLALLYLSQGKYAQAEPLFQRAIAMSEKNLGEEHPDVAIMINNLAVLYKNLGKYSQAEPLYHQARKIQEKAVGLEHPSLAQTLNNLAKLYYVQGKYEEAEPLYLQAIAIREQALGSNHPDVAQSVNNLGGLCRSRGLYGQAELLFQRALRIREQTLGANHPDVASSLNELGLLYTAQGKYTQAELLYKRALAIREQALGQEHPEVACSLENYATLLKETNREGESLELEARATTIRAKYAQKNR